MSLELGDLEGLAVALGLMDSDGELVGDWFTRPGHYLSSVSQVAMCGVAAGRLGSDGSGSGCGGERGLLVVVD